MPVSDIRHRKICLHCRVLSETEGKVKLVATGPLSSLARLLLSGPDEHSALSGVELVR